VFGTTFIACSLAERFGKTVDETGEDVAYQSVFGQSEQAFLSFLESSDKDKMNLHSIMPDLKEGDESKTYDVDLFFYSTKDICRYCRGTLAYLLYSSKLKVMMQRTLRSSSFKDDPRLSEDRPSDLIKNIRLFAFSKNPAEI
jgi:hypothetical protein